MKIVLIDQDETIAQFETALYERLRLEGVPAIPVTQRRTYWVTDQYEPQWARDIERILAQRGFYENLEPVPGAIEAILEIARLQDVEVRICTSPVTSRYGYEEKHDWVRRHLGESFLRRIITTPDKTLVRGDVLVDDNPWIYGICLPQWRHVLFSNPNNSEVDHPLRLTSWAHWREELLPLLLP